MSDDTTRSRPPIPRATPPPPPRARAHHGYPLCDVVKHCTGTSWLGARSDIGAWGRRHPVGAGHAPPADILKRWNIWEVFALKLKQAVVVAACPGISMRPACISHRAAMLPRYRLNQHNPCSLPTSANALQRAAEEGGVETTVDCPVLRRT